MNVDLAVVRLPYRPGSGPVRTGTVLLQEDDLYLVRWDDDGSEEEVHLGDYESVVQRGSLRYLATVDCERFRAVFDADPITVVLQVLAENDGPMTAKTLRIYLVNLGLDKNVLTSKWSKVAKHLLSRDGVTVVGEGSARTYAWFGGDLPDLSPVAGVEQMQAPTRDGDEPAPAKWEPVELGMPAGGLATEAVSVADPSPDVEQSESGVTLSGNGCGASGCGASGCGASGCGADNGRNSWARSCAAARGTDRADPCRTYRSGC